MSAPPPCMANAPPRAAAELAAKVQPVTDTSMAGPRAGTVFSTAAAPPPTRDGLATPNAPPPMTAGSADSRAASAALSAPRVSRLRSKVQPSSL